MMPLRRWLFWVGLGLAGLCAFLGFTPTVWILEGRPDESYPELFFAFIALPAALVVTVVGLVLALRSGRRERRRKGMER
jgi:uncharacterized membrane protein